MTLEEAEIIARVIGSADGGCSVCVFNLAEELNAAFPAFVWEVPKGAVPYMDANCVDRRPVVVRPAA